MKLNKQFLRAGLLCFGLSILFSACSDKTTLGCYDFGYQNKLPIDTTKEEKKSS